MKRQVSWLKAMNPRETKLNILLLAVPVTVYFNYIEQDSSLAFFSSLVAIMPLAFLMGRATEEIALRTSESIGLRGVVRVKSSALNDQITEYSMKNRTVVKTGLHVR